MIIAIAAATFVATLLGGWFALHFKDKLHLILGFSAGAVIGVAFFDLLPEAIELASARYDAAVATTLVAVGFFVYLVIDRLLVGHAHHGTLGAGSLALHSFLDGVAVGLAFQVSAAVGGVVAAAVLAHDFSDGINTVNLILKNRRDGAQTAWRWVWIDAAAPVAGVIATMFFSVPAGALGVILALFAGFFLYIGASDLLPESYHDHPRALTTILTLLGAALLFIVIRLAGL